MAKSSTTDKILVLLKKHPRGLTINEIAEILGVSRLTISKYVFALAAQGKIRQRQIGAAKMCYLEE